jgi:ferric-dicitrate binding protein FerR (iron transport regulator)
MIFSGDAINVGEGGSVLLSFSPTGRASLAGSTQVRFSGAEGNIVAQLLSGTLAVKRENKDAFVVKTSTHRVEPKGEGMAEFLVALLPDKRAIVEAQHGKVAITETRSGESYTLAEGLLAQIPAPATGAPGQAENQGEVIGKVITSGGATRNGKPLAADGWVYDGDAVATGAGGRVVIQLWPANQITLNENTTASFTRPVDRVWLHLQNGTIVAESSGESTPLIATAKFHIEPTSAGPGKINVQVMADDSTSIESAFGDFRIGEIPTGQSYLLPAGKKVLVPANASGIPGLQPLRGTPAETPTPSAPTSPAHPTPASGSKSHSTLIIVAIAAGGGIAGAAAALAGGGHGGSSPVSSSAP